MFKVNTRGLSIHRSKDSKYGTSRDNLSLIQSIEDDQWSTYNRSVIMKVIQPYVHLSIVWKMEDCITQRLKVNKLIND